jgi:hypothetical protein
MLVNSLLLRPFLAIKRYILFMIKIWKVKREKIMKNERREIFGLSFFTCAIIGAFFASIERFNVHET